MSSCNRMVSIIMNCYNSERFLKEAIDSIYAQSFDDWEIIFWDNLSTDRSASIAKSYDTKLKYYLADKHTDLGEARNQALSKAKGKYIAFLDCDDMYFPHKLSLQVEFLENNDFALVYSGVIHIKENGETLRKTSPQNNSGYVFSNLLRHYEINMQSVILKKSILDDSGLVFDDYLKYCPDYNLFMQIAAQYNVGVIKEPLVFYRVSSNSLSRHTFDIVSYEMKLTLDKLFTSSPELRKKYKNSVDAAYSKLNYYDAVAMIYKSNFVLARKKLKKIVFKRWEYLTLYLILYLPMSQRIILRLLNRY